MPRRLAIVSAPPVAELEQSVSDYLAHCKAKGLSRKTVDHYEAVLERVWLPFLAAQKVTTLAGINQRVVDRLSTQMLEVGGARGVLSRHSIHSYLRAISSYLKWSRGEGELTSPAKPQLPKRPQRVLNVLTRDQIRAMEDAAGNERDKLIVRILADCGLRLAELLGLRLGDLIIQGRDDRFLRVMGKGSRERLVPISPSLFKRIDRYVKGGRPKDAHNDKLFVSLRAKDGDYEPLEFAARPGANGGACGQGWSDRPSRQSARAATCLRNVVLAKGDEPRTAPADPRARGPQHDLERLLASRTGRCGRGDDGRPPGRC